MARFYAIQLQEIVYEGVRGFSNTLSNKTFRHFGGDDTAYVECINNT